MPTRNVLLTDHQARVVEHLVKSGRYQNASEVMRAGLRLVERQEAEEELRLDALREAVRVGQSDVDAGRHRLLRTPDEVERLVIALSEEADPELRE